jgi:hypothetical protein
MTSSGGVRAAPKTAAEAPQRARNVALSRIVEDPAIQPRFRMSRDAVNRYTHLYRNARRELPPILCCTIGGDERLILIDGFHRVRAARRARLTQLSAIIIGTTLEEAKWLAVEANFKHGVPLTGAEKRIIFRRFVNAGRNRRADGALMSSRELSMALPVGSHQSMLNWMKADFPKLHSEMTRHEPEEEEPEDDEGSRKEDQALANIEWAESEYLAAIRKAAAVVPKERIAEIVHDIRERVEEALGVPDVAQLLPEREECDDF